MNNEHTIVVARWRAERRGNGCYVIQQLDDSGQSTVYGPMPESFVAPLISELKQVVEKTSLRHLGRYNAPDIDEQFL